MQRFPGYMQLRWLRSGVSKLFSKRPYLVMRNRCLSDTEANYRLLRVVCSTTWNQSRGPCEMCRCRIWPAGCTFGTFGPVQVRTGFLQVRTDETVRWNTAWSCGSWSIGLIAFHRQTKQRTTFRGLRSAPRSAMCFTIVVQESIGAANQPAYVQGSLFFLRCIRAS